MTSGSTASQADVRWAVRTKLADDARYQITADDSGGHDAGAYESLIQKFVLGTPTSSPPGTTDALPWVVVGPVDRPDGVKLAVVIHEWPPAAVRDRAGRPVSRTRYFELPWSAVHGAGYANLHAAVQHLTPLDGEMPRLAIAQFDAAGAIARLEGPNWRWMPLAAAALLDGRLVLAGAPSAAAGERLALLDTILALLPRGLRATLVAASWSTPDGTIQPHLSYGRSATVGATLFDLAGDGLPALRTDAAREYHDRLWWVAGKHGIPAVVETLWAAGEPNGWSPDDLLAGLAPLDRTVALRYTIRKGQATAEQVRQRLREEPAGSIDPDVAGQLVGFLLVLDQPSDLALIDRHWSEPVADVFLDGVFDGRLNDGFARGLEQSTHDEDALLGLLARARDYPPDPTVRFLGSRLPPLSTVVRERLISDQRLTTYLLIQLARSAPQRLDDWLRYLTARPDRTEPQDPPWLGPFAAMSAGHCAPLARHDAELLDEAPRTMLALLLVGLRRGCPEPILGASEAWARLVTKLPNIAGMANDLERVTATEFALAPAHRASLDMLLTRVGLPATVRRLSLGEEDRAAYLAEIRQRFVQLTAPAGQACARGLAQSILTHPAPSAVRFAIALADRVPQSARPLVYEQLGAFLTEFPQLLSATADDAESLLARLREHSPKLLASVRRFELQRATMLTSASPARARRALGSAVHDAIAESVPEQDVFEVLRPWIEAGRSAEDVFAVLSALADAVSERSGPRRGDEVLTGVVRAVLGEAAGPEAATNMSRFLPGHIDAQQRRLTTLSAEVKPSRSSRRARWSGRGQTPPAGRTEATEEGRAR
ncbi:hypothetical protein AB0J74_32880 [Asanoa sp. NPDC049573]|uniref:hypothetical protein n=1 Tax=Asanoa sp. NPDC049573 TaxID=3155396 RepID=UPI00343276FB